MVSMVVPEGAFYMVGTIDEAIQKHKEIREGEKSMAEPMTLQIITPDYVVFGPIYILCR